MIASQTPQGLSYTQQDLAAMVVGDDEYGHASYGNILSVVPGDLNNDGMSDWLVSDWAYFDTNNSLDKGALFVSFQR